MIVFDRSTRTEENGKIKMKEKGTAFKGKRIVYGQTRVTNRARILYGCVIFDISIRSNKNPNVMCKLGDWIIH